MCFILIHRFLINTAFLSPSPVGYLPARRDTRSILPCERQSAFRGVRKKAGLLHAGARPGPAADRIWTKKCAGTHAVSCLRIISFVIAVSDVSITYGLVVSKAERT